MPKGNKPNTSAQKRFKITGTGKILRRQAGMRHLLSDKSRRRKRRLKKEVELTYGQAKRLKHLL
ncbi:MAG: 50S ribosomal protein L35 [Brevinematales bacterium]|nr:50S ribosomal protein L35 [Brevinematales bacterium]